MLSKMSEDEKSLYISNETPNNKNYNETFLTNLCKSSKKLIKNSRRYNSYIELPKYFKHAFPFRPNSSKASSESSFDFNLSINYNKKESICVKKKIIGRDSKFLLKLKKIRFIPNISSVNEEIFLDFIDRSNINTKFKKEFNDYLENHQINRDINFNVYKLLSIMKYYKIDKNIFFDKKSYSKINKFITKNNLLIKLKISSLKIAFYEFNQKLKSNNSNNDISFISKINFPFEFISFFYGLNLNDFLKFLILVINYDFSENKFNLNFPEFIKLYHLYKDKQYFFGEKSFFKIYGEKTEEYLAYYWDVKNGKDTKNFLMKILLPKISIGIGDWRKNVFFKFFYSLEIDKIVHLMKDNFKLWDFFVMKFFSDYKMFRLEVNRILCNKYKSNNNNLKEIKFGHKINLINYNNKNKSKRVFNFNNINSILKNSINDLQFFYTRKNTLSGSDNETFLFQIEIPKIHINYRFKNIFIDKFFDLNMKKLLQMNKLKKSFKLEDLVKFSMSIVDKSEKKTKVIKKLSFFESNKFRRNKKSATLSSDFNQIRANVKSRNFKLDQFGSSKNISNIKKRTTLISNNKKEQKEIKKDIKLNLDKYIFNFDEDILKFIKPKEKKKNEIKEYNDLNTNKIKLIRRISNKSNIGAISGYHFNNEQNNIKIEFGKMKLIWTEKDSKEFVYILEEKENQYLLDNPSFLWRDYIQNRIDNFKEKLKGNNII